MWLGRIACLSALCWNCWSCVTRLTGSGIWEGREGGRKVAVLGDAAWAAGLAMARVAMSNPVSGGSHNLVASEEEEEEEQGRRGRSGAKEQDSDNDD